MLEPHASFTAWTISCWTPCKLYSMDPLTHVRTPCKLYSMDHLLLELRVSFTAWTHSCSNPMQALQHGPSPVGTSSFFLLPIRNDWWSLISRFFLMFLTCLLLLRKDGRHGNGIIERSCRREMSLPRRVLLCVICLWHYVEGTHFIDNGF